MKLLTSLCTGNQRILWQKIGLMQALVAKHGEETARELYQKTCPIVKATIGQHVRHSLDHIEPAILSGLDEKMVDIYYDRRTRGRADEHDWDAANDRLMRVTGLLEALSMRETEQHAILERPVKACFMLSGDSEEEFPLVSTVSRELGFAMHHAIHHMAMLRIMATCSHVGQLKDEELPSDFGRAPSTVNFDNNVINQ